MKKSRKIYTSLFFVAILAIALLLLLFGSFFDLQIASSMFGKLGEASVILSLFVPLPGYVLLAISGSMLVSSWPNGKTKIQNILLKTPIFLTPIASGLLYGYFSFTKALSLPIALLTGLFVMGIMTALWLWVENKNGKRNLTKEAFAIISSFVLVLLIVWILNQEILRYSYKAIVSEGNKENLFSAWWVLEGKDPEFLKENTIDLSLLRGGPSLDCALSAFALFLPFVLPKGAQEKTWISGLIVALFVLLGIFVELSVGEYFLSAIAWGLGIGATLAGLILFFMEYPSFKVAPPSHIKKREEHLWTSNQEAASRALRLTKSNSLRLQRNRKKSRNKKKQIIILKSLDNDVPPSSMEVSSL